MPNTPNTKYISVDRLGEFLTALRGKYADNALTGDYQVSYAHNADQATKDGAGNIISSTYATQTALSDLDSAVVKTITVTTPTGAPAGVRSGNTYTLDLSGYALKTEIAAALHFKNVVATYSDLPSTDVAIGDLYIVTTGLDTGETNVEYVCTAIDPSITWQKLGPTKDFSNFVQKKSADAGKIAIFDSNGDIIGGASLATALGTGSVADGDSHFVTGGQVATAIANLGTIVNDVKVGVSGSEASVVSGGEAVITLADAVTENDPKPVTSGAVYGAIHALDYSKVVAADGTAKIDILYEATAADITGIFPS